MQRLHKSQHSSCKTNIEIICPPGENFKNTHGRIPGKTWEVWIDSGVCSSNANFPWFLVSEKRPNFHFPFYRYKYTWRSPHSNSFMLQKTNRAQVCKESETWPLEFQLCSCWVSSVLGLQQVRSHEWKHWVHVFSAAACMRFLHLHLKCSI